jgi:hypothetical protein
VLGVASQCCKDQTCSRFIQSKLAASVDLDDNDPLSIDKDLFYEEICSDEKTLLLQKQAS